jgi:hypothetical protein
MCLAPEAVLIRYDPVPGDVTNDGRVNLDDFGILRSHFGRSNARRINGDLTADGRVSLDDFGELKANWGTAPLAGDANGDRFVDAWDFRLLVQDFRKVGFLSTDFDGNLRVDLADFALLHGKLTEFQAIVPEPAGWALLATGGLAYLAVRPRQLSSQRKVSHG